MAEASLSTVDPKKRLAVVAGGGSGIGRGCALKLAAAGWQVLLLGRTESRLEETAATIRQQQGSAFVFAVDTRDWDRLGALQEALGEISIGILINCAGGQFGAPAETLSRNGWQSVVDVNLSGSFFLSRRLFPALSRSGAGVVHVVANAWQRGAPSIAHSAASRAGVVNLCQTLAVEWARFGIRVNAVSPGMTLTEAAARYPTFEAEIANVPLRRAASVEEVADAILFMAQAPYITGEVLTIDGGQQLVGFRTSMPDP